MHRDRDYKFKCFGTNVINKYLLVKLLYRNQSCMQNILCHFLHNTMLQCSANKAASDFVGKVITVNNSGVTKECSKADGIVTLIGGCSLAAQSVAYLSQNLNLVQVMENSSFTNI